MTVTKRKFTSKNYMLKLILKCMMISDKNPVEM